MSLDLSEESVDFITLVAELEEMGWDHDEAQHIARDILKGENAVES